MSTPNTANFGREFHVGDCYVWSEIYYLDSITDYREYLSPPVVRTLKITRNESAMLDRWRISSRQRTFLAFGVVLLCLAAFWLLSYGLLYLQVSR
jgi:hypothetical protein